MHLVYSVPSNTTVELSVKYITGTLYIVWGDGSMSTYLTTTGIQSHVYERAGTYNIYIVGKFTQYGYSPVDETAVLSGMNYLKRVESFGTLAKISNLANAFRGADSLEYVCPIPSSVRSINYMFFRSDGNFTGVAAWDVTKIASAAGLFNNCTLYNEDIGNLNWASLTNATDMFRGATTFNQSLANWKFNTMLPQNGHIVVNGIFTGSGLSQDNYNLTLIGWNEYATSNPNVKLRIIDADVAASGDGLSARAALKQKLWFFRDATPP
jgi:hypothetical protein